MTIYFSSETFGFLTPELHGDKIYEGAVEISLEQYEELLQEQAKGRRIVADEDGRPQLLDPAPVTKDVQRSLIASRRLSAETSGISIKGIGFSTSRDSQALVNGALLAAMLDANYRCQWKTTSGFVEIDAVEIKAIASSVRAHVQACFDREAELLAHLEAGTFEESMLDQGWPA
ncbi:MULTISPECIES: DUF4376 domain-containing protein [Pseudomonas]|jgi:hypothetical protein|uniref:DUF4376 domain-containing protein n=1 Tax=Pseudomonas TaxID=286 RepID=UPI0005BA1F84|nr:MULTISPECIES: DUF4376 domain-containing protein [Pseudomonas]KWR71279.1 phage tail protein [Pseudomonas sp. PI1]WAB94604.1 DUF4376 domain-containing protein [Pseudomonas citronellolis]